MIYKIYFYQYKKQIFVILTGKLPSLCHLLPNFFGSLENLEHNFGKFKKLFVIVYHINMIKIKVLSRRYFKFENNNNMIKIKSAFKKIL